MLHLALAPAFDTAIRDLAAHMPPGGAGSVLHPWTIVVPRASAQRRVSQRLAHVLGAQDHALGAGVSANIDMVLPNAIYDLVRAPSEGGNSWSVERMAWQLMGLCDQPGVRRWRQVHRIADDLDRSQKWRPDVVQGWIDRYQGPALEGLKVTGLSYDLAAMLAYLRVHNVEATLVEQAGAFIGHQARLVQAREQSAEAVADTDQVTINDGHNNPDDRNNQGDTEGRQIQAGSSPSDMSFPARWMPPPHRPILLFGVHGLSVLQLSILAAYARTHEVYWWITTPMVKVAKTILDQARQGDIGITFDPTDTFILRPERRAFAYGSYVNQPFVAANGRATIEGLHGIAQCGLLSGFDLRVIDPVVTGKTVLARMQGAIRHDQSETDRNESTTTGQETSGVQPTAPIEQHGQLPQDGVAHSSGQADQLLPDPQVEDAAAPPSGKDGVERSPSITRIATSRPQRQVEALRDFLLHAFMDDPDLEPRDVLVACPDPTLWEAPIRRAFAPLEHRPNLRLRVINPASPVANPVADVVLNLLTMACGQVTRTQFVDLLAEPPVAARFGLSDQDIEDLGAYLDQTHMTWGLDAEDRTFFNLPALPGGTLQDSLDQLILGFTHHDIALNDLPAFGVKASHISLMGRLVEAAQQVKTFINQARSPMSIAQGWAPAITELLDTFVSVDLDHGWQITHILRALNWMTEAAQAHDQPIGVDEFTEIFSDTALIKAGRGDLGAGDLVVTNLSNARGIPAKVVCLLGMDDGRVPRPRSRSHIPEFGAERLGDLDEAARDRQSVLDLVAGSCERLCVIWSAPPQGGEAVPSVIVNDLNTLLASVGGGNHPELAIKTKGLHRWSVRDHQGDASTDVRAAQLAKVSVANRGASQVADRLAHLRRDPLEPVVLPDTLTIADLVRFGQDPLQAYAKHSRGIGWLGHPREAGDEVINANLDNLKRWAMMDMSLRRDEPAEDLMAREVRSGLLPGEILSAALPEAMAEMRYARDQILAHYGIDQAQSMVAGLNLTLTSPSGWTVHIRDRLPLWRRQDGTYALVLTTASSVKAANVLTQWIQWLLLQQAYPQVPIEAIYILKGKEGLEAVTFLPVTDEQVPALLTQFIDGVETGLREPLIAPMATALAWARSKKRTVSDIRAAWEGSGFGFSTPDREAGSVVRLVGANLPAEWVWAQDCGGMKHLDILADAIWVDLLAFLDKKHPLKGRY